MRKTIQINTEKAMLSLGEKIGQYADPGMVIALSGDLGAGKTTLTKGIGKGLGINEVINSPTFTILKIYEGRLKLYHFDVYRLDNHSGDDDLEEFFYMGGLSVIEWAENINNILPKERLDINIKTISLKSREVTLFANTAAYIDIVNKALL